MHDERGFSKALREDGRNVPPREFTLCASTRRWNRRGGTECPTDVSAAANAISAAANALLLYFFRVSQELSVALEYLGFDFPRQIHSSREEGESTALFTTVWPLNLHHPTRECPTCPPARCATVPKAASTAAAPDAAAAATSAVFHVASLFACPSSLRREGVMKLAILNGKFTIPRGRRGPLGQEYSAAFCELISWTLTADPASRPRCPEIIKRVQEMVTRR